MVQSAKILAGFVALVGLAEAQKAAKYSKSIALSYELLSDTAGSPSPLATIEYDHRSLEYTLASWTPPSTDSLISTSKEETSSPLLQVLLPNGASTLASLKTFDPNLSQDIDVWISRDSGEVISASVRSESPPPLSQEEELQRQKEERLRKRGKDVPTSKPKPKKSKAKEVKDVIVEEKKAGPQVRVNLHVAGSGPVPKFNTRQPPQLDAEGNEVVQEEQQEKTFLQKYWYIMLALAFVLVTGGGGGGKE